MDDELKILRRNFRQYLIEFYGSAPPFDRKRAEALLQKDGTLVNVDYSSDLVSSSWPPCSHLYAMISLLPDDPAAARSMLSAWERIDPASKNWWWGEIGIPECFCRTLIMLDEDVKIGSKTEEILSRAQLQERFTGQNLVWAAGIEAAKGMLTGNAEMVRRGRDIIAAELIVSAQEGLKEDWSFHQHGAQPQFGNYGLSWLLDMALWTCVFDRTSYAFEQEKLNLLINFYHQGQKWMLVGDHYDINNCGRQFHQLYPAGKVKRIRAAVKCMQSRGLLQDDNQPFYGCKAWRCSDLLMSRRPDYCFSLRMNSNKIIPNESCCRENLQGRYSADGATMIYPAYQSIQESLILRNWRQVPGTTELLNIGDLAPLPDWEKNAWNGNGLGSCWGAGDFGAALMQLRTGSVAADKAWFCLRDTIVCMGKNISSEEPDTVATTLLQEIVPDKFMLDGAAATQSFITADSPAELLAGKMKYLFPAGGKLCIGRQTVTSSWRAVAAEGDPAEFTGEMASVYFDHGIKPQNESYCYLIVPAMLEAEKVEFIKTPFALGVRARDCTLIAFFDAGKVGDIVMEKAGLYIAQNGQEIRQFA